MKPAELARVTSARVAGRHSWGNEILMRASLLLVVAADTLPSAGCAQLPEVSQLPVEQSVAVARGGWNSRVVNPVSLISPQAVSESAR